MPLPIINLRHNPKSKNSLLLALFLATFWSLMTSCWSGVAVKESNGTSSPQVSDADSIQNSLFGEDVVSLSAETAGLFSINNSNNYRYLPQLITVGWQLDEIGNEGWNRGNTEFLFSGMYAPVIHGPNPWFTGGLFGPRYNFIQEGWPVVPYLESRVGFMFTNATGAPNSQGQDFCFSFTVGAGVRIPVMQQLSVNLGVLYQHISNGGLSEPEHQNVGLDSIGPTLSVTWAF
ncbi:MAG: hypothetical protein EBS97_05930 [Verrucomicrobia bacterium]|nr:hypothetical protein [Verrucomicrobiota bacterium]